MAEQNIAQTDITVVAQYVKDLSFENPRILQYLSNPKGAPSIKVNVQVEANQLKDNIYEVVLMINVKAEYENEVAFIVELNYAGAFSLSESVEEGAIKPLLLVKCPELLFPFARHIVSDVVREGGMPPLHLSMMNFQELYENREKVNN